MAKKQINLEVRIIEVSKALSSGVDRDNIVSKFGKKWQVSPRSIDRYIKTAKIEAEKAVAAKKKAEEEAQIEAAKDAELRRLLGRNEKREILAKIARRELEIEKVVYDDAGMPKKIKVKPDFISMMKAIDLDAKMEGDFAPTKAKVETTHSFLDFLKETSADESV